MKTTTTNLNQPMLPLTAIAIIVLAFCPTLCTSVRPSNPESFIRSIGGLLGVNETTTLAQLYPDLALHNYNLHQAVPWECYDPDVAGIEVNIFYLPVLEVVTTFMRTHSYLLEDEDPLVITKRIRTLIENLRPLSRMILKCLTQPPGMRNRLGLTSMAVYSQLEFMGMQNNKLGK